MGALLVHQPHHPDRPGVDPGIRHRRGHHLGDLARRTGLVATHLAPPRRRRQFDQGEFRQCGGRVSGHGHRIDSRSQPVLALAAHRPRLERDDDADLGDSDLRDAAGDLEHRRGYRLSNRPLQHRRERPSHHRRYRGNGRRFDDPLSDGAAPAHHLVGGHRRRGGLRPGAGGAQGLHRGARGHRDPHVQLRLQCLLTLRAHRDRVAGARPGQRPLAQRRLDGHPPADLRHGLGPTGEATGSSSRRRSWSSPCGS